MSRPSGVVMWQMLILFPPKCLASLLIALCSADAGRFLRWSLVHDSGSRRIMESSSAWTLTRLPVARASDTAGTSSSSSFRSMLPVVEPMNSLNPGTYLAIMPALMFGVTAANRP